MNEFVPIDAACIDGVFDRIGKQWMLISATDGKHTNTMTASWGCLGVLWNKPVAVCFIRPQRYTYTLTEKAEHLSLAFLGEAHRAALTYCGRNSGRDGDKFAAAGLHCVMTEGGVPYPAEAELVLICRKLYADDLKKASFLDASLLSNYAKDDFHRVYICEIEQALVRKSTQDLP
ncbi:MAG: flavin reductase family protein [Clostridia bacterium]|nr:flavin reductase family protein [Clostridia bacterium]